MDLQIDTELLDSGQLNVVSGLASCLGAASVVIYACLLTGACGRNLIAQ